MTLLRNIKGDTGSLCHIWNSTPQKKLSLASQAAELLCFYQLNF